MPLVSEDVLRDWCPERVYDYAQENGIDLTLGEAYILIHKCFPKAPYGWITGFVYCPDRDRDENASPMDPVPYWSEEDAAEDADIYRDRGYDDVQVTQSVDHETMCKLLDEMIHDAREEKDLL